MLQSLDPHSSGGVSFTPTETPNPQVPSTLGWATPQLGLPQKEFDSIIVIVRAPTDSLGSLCPLSGMQAPQPLCCFVKEELQDLSWACLRVTKNCFIFFVVCHSYVLF